MAVGVLKLGGGVESMSATRTEAKRSLCSRRRTRWVTRRLLRVLLSRDRAAAGARAARPSIPGAVKTELIEAASSTRPPARLAASQAAGSATAPTRSCSVRIL